MISQDRNAGMCWRKKLEYFLEVFDVSGKEIGICQEKRLWSLKEGYEDLEKGG